MLRCHVSVGHSNSSVLSTRLSNQLIHRISSKTKLHNNFRKFTVSTSTEASASVPKITENTVKWKTQAPTRYLEKSEYIKQIDEEYLQSELKKQSDRILVQVKKRTDELKHIFFNWIPYVLKQRSSADRSKVMQYKQLKRILADRTSTRILELGTYRELAGLGKELSDDELLEEEETNNALLPEEELFKIRLAGLPIILKEPMESVPTYDFANIPTQEKTQAHIDEAHKRFLVADAQLKEIRDEFREYSKNHGDHYRKYQYYTGEMKNTQDRVLYIAHEISEYLKVYGMILDMRKHSIKKEMLQRLNNVNLWLAILLLLILLYLLRQIWKFLSWNSLDEWNVAHAWTPALLSPELFVSRQDQDAKMKTMLQDSFGKYHGGVYVVLGEHGCGKTTLLEQAIAELGRTDILQIHAAADEEQLAAQLSKILDKKPSFLNFISQGKNNSSFDNYILRFCETCVAMYENTNIVRKFLQASGFWPQVKSPVLLINDLDSALVLDHSGTAQSPVLEKLIRVAHKIGVENSLCKVVVVATPAVLPHLTTVSKQLSDFEYVYVGDLTATQAQDFLLKTSNIRGWKLEQDQTRNIISTIGTRCSDLLAFVDSIDKQHQETSMPINDNLINKNLQMKVLQAHKQLKSIPAPCQKVLKEWADETKSNKFSQRSEDWIKMKFKSSLWDYQFVAYKSLLQQGIIKWNPVEKTVDFSTPLMLNTTKLLSNK